MSPCGLPRRAAALLCLLLAGVVDAVTFCTSDGIRFKVDTDRALDHSRLLQRMLEDGCALDFTPLPLPADRTDERVLALIRDFMLTVEANAVDDGPDLWIQRWFRIDVVTSKEDTKRQCRLLTLANFLEMRPLMLAVLSISRPEQYEVMSEFLGVDLLQTVADAASINQLDRFAAHNPEQKDLVRNLRRLAAFGADPEQATHVDANVRWSGTMGVLHWAVLNDERRLVVTLLDRVPGFDANTLDDLYGMTPLQFALELGPLEVLTLILAAAPRVDVNARDRLGHTPLLSALDRNVTVDNRFMRQLLRTPGIDVAASLPDGTSPLHLAARHDHHDCANMLLEVDGIQVDAQITATLQTPLHWAVLSDSVNVARSLLGKGADVGARDSWQRTPLHWAARYGRYEICEMLLSVAAEWDVLHQDINGQTERDLAVANRHRRIVALLAEHKRRMARLRRQWFGQD